MILGLVNPRLPDPLHLFGASKSRIFCRVPGDTAFPQWPAVLTAAIPACNKLLQEEDHECDEDHDSSNEEVSTDLR